MSESERNERRRVVAMVGNPTSDKGRGAKVDAQVLGLLAVASRWASWPRGRATISHED